MKENVETATPVEQTTTPVEQTATAIEQTSDSLGKMSCKIILGEFVITYEAVY